MSGPGDEAVSDSRQAHRDGIDSVGCNLCTAIEDIQRMVEMARDDIGGLVCEDSKAGEYRRGELSTQLGGIGALAEKALRAAAALEDLARRAAGVQSCP